MLTNYSTAIDKQSPEDREHGDDEPGQDNDCEYNEYDAGEQGGDKYACEDAEGGDVGGYESDTHNLGDGGYEDEGMGHGHHDRNKENEVEQGKKVCHLLRIFSGTHVHCPSEIRLSRVMKRLQLMF